MRVLGEALAQRGILTGDVLIVDAAAESRSGVVAIIMIGGEVLLGQLRWRAGRWWLRSSQADREPLLLGEEAEI